MMKQSEFVLSRERINELLHKLNDELLTKNIEGEILMVGGAVMSLVYFARESTKDIDALFAPKAEMYAAIESIAKTELLPDGWLNDAVKGFLVEAAEFKEYLNLSHLKVLTAVPEYLLAMKCLSCRTDVGSYDKDDITFLLRHLDIKTKDHAISLITNFYPEKRFPTRAFFILDECLEEISRK
jgi:hypothetical protein